MNRNNWRLSVPPLTSIMQMVVCLLIVTAAATVNAAVQPHPLFSDGAVLQQGMAVPVWGTAADGERVTVRLQGQQAQAVARDGKWMVRLKSLQAGGPFQMTISEGQNTLQINNVMVGEVWVCSGQSNMAWILANTTNAQEEIANSKNPQLRMFTVAQAALDAPTSEVKGSWQESNPENAGKFSAVAYFFGRALQKARRVPVGLINTSVGGTPIDAWMSRRTLESNPQFKEVLERYAQAIEKYPQALEQYKSTLAKHEQAVAEAKQQGRPAPQTPQPPYGPESRTRPAALYNGMVAPLVPYAIRGALWYQGESEGSRGKGALYRTLLPTLITSWREAWGQGEFPFLFVQLAPYAKIANDPNGDIWADLREAQLLTSLQTPKTAMAVITDVGEAEDIHPRQKAPVGERLALAARAIAYGERIIYSGPVYAGMKVDKDRAILSFNHVGSGLMAKGGALTGFTIAGPDGKFVDATAEIKGDKVVVYSPQVTRPVAVRYGWKSYPVVNLWNKEGLPASPFRTDGPAISALSSKISSKSPSH